MWWDVPSRRHSISWKGRSHGSDGYSRRGHAATRAVGFRALKRHHLTYLIQLDSFLQEGCYSCVYEGAMIHKHYKKVLI
jgi:hypothetical protein